MIKGGLYFFAFFISNFRAQVVWRRGFGLQIRQASRDRRQGWRLGLLRFNGKMGALQQEGGGAGKWMRRYCRRALALWGARASFGDLSRNKSLSLFSGKLARRRRAGWFSDIYIQERKGSTAFFKKAEFYSLKSHFFRTFRLSLKGTRERDKKNDQAGRGISFPGL